MFHKTYTFSFYDIANIHLVFIKQKKFYLFLNKTDVFNVKFFCYETIQSILKNVCQRIGQQYLKR